MSNYQRLISYIYEYEGEIKGKNIGFAKLETRNGQCRITVNVKKIYVGGNPIGVYLLSGKGEVRIGTIFARNGAAEFRTVVNASNVENSGNGIERFYGLSVHDVESSWQSYTTIWEDAVAHAAEIELANVTAESRQDAAKEESAEKEEYQVTKEIEEALELEEQMKEQMVDQQEELVKDQVKDQVEENKQDENPTADPEEEIVLPGGGDVWNRDTAGRRTDRDPLGRIRRILEPIAELASMQDPTRASKSAQAPLPEPIPESIPSTIPVPAPKMIRPTVPKPELPSEPLEIPMPEMQPPPEPMPEEGANMETQPLAGMQPEARTQPELEAQPDKVLRPETEPQSDLQPHPDPSEQPQLNGEPYHAFERNAAALHRFDEEEQSQYTHQNVWDRLRKIYPKVQAFDYEQGSEILMIKPQDIGLLPREAWVHGNNSFLLHGFYNYRYLILARLENPNGEPRYLLGIPGHYYSNEKYMAAMFGYPNFVLAKNQPPNDVRFGYWYTDIKVGD